MRFIPVGCLQDGMISARQVLGKHGELLLNKDTVIQTAYIKKLIALGYSGIYIEDKLSEEIKVSEIISQDLRLKTVKTIKTAYETIESGKDISQSRMQDINHLVENIVEEALSNENLMVNMVDLKIFDDYTFYHSVNVAVLSVVIGIGLKMGKDQLAKLVLSAMLHDVGKVFIPREVLNKPGRLNNMEFEMMKGHPYKGYKYLRDHFDVPMVSYIGILQHHEKYDGTGYPLNTKGEQISLFGRIISVADIYDALTSDRPYRKALTPSDAAEYIMGAGGTVLDPNLVRCFMQNVAPYPVGMYVRLSNNMEGLVIENYKDCCIRPKVKIIRHGGLEVTPYIIDLKNDAGARDITIVGLVTQEMY